MYKGQNKKPSIRRYKARHPIGQGPRLRPSDNKSEGRMKHTEGLAHSEERAALPFKGAMTREPRSRMARQQYRIFRQRGRKICPRRKAKQQKASGDNPTEKRLCELLNDGVKKHPTSLTCILET